MLSFIRILVIPFALGLSTAVLTACGQPGALYLPTEPTAAQRATLPQTLHPFHPSLPASSPVSP